MRRYQQQSHRQGGPKREGGHGGPRMRNDSRRRPGGRPSGRGPQTCPMCGAVVGDLKFHIQSKHDDAASHPRE
jgi:hypothetical protein